MNDRCPGRGDERETSVFDNLLIGDDGFFPSASRQLAGFLSKMDVPRCAIEDLIAEAWLRAVKHHHQFVGAEPERLYSWLRKVVQRLALDWKHHLAAHFCETLDTRKEEPSDERPMESAEKAEQLEQLNAFLEQVGHGDERSVQLLRRHYFAGVSIQELAQQFGMTAKAVDGRIRRLVKKLRAMAE